MWSSGFSGTLLLLLLLPTTLAFKASDFKTCSQSGFCRRGRALSARAQESGASWNSPYAIEPSSFSVASHQAAFTADVKSSIYPSVKFSLDVRIQQDGVVRVRMDEVDGLRKRYDQAAQWALVEEPSIHRDIRWTVGKTNAKAIYGPKKDIEVVVDFKPLKITLFRGGKEQIVLNERGLLHMEHFRTKEDSLPEGQVEAGGQTVLQVDPAAWFEGDSQDALWEETFSSWTDSKPKGACHDLSTLRTMVPRYIQVPNPFPSTSRSPTTPMSTVSLNTLPTSPSQVQAAPTQNTPIHSVSTTQTFLNTLPTLPCHSTAPSH